MFICRDWTRKVPAIDATVVEDCPLPIIYPAIPLTPYPPQHHDEHFTAWIHSASPLLKKLMMKDSPCYVVLDEREERGWSGREEGWTHDRSGDMPLSELRI